MPKNSLIAILCVCAAMLAFCFMMMIKCNVTLKCRIKIICAIRDYKLYCFDNRIDAKVDYVDMENYDETLRRIWDWSYKRILPTAKFKIIEPFIEK